MRLSVFTVDTPSQQLILDLQKLYKSLFEESKLKTQALYEELQTEHSHYFVTMFNDRHIGAVKVTITKQEARLSNLCVRDITRRRGVGKNLLKQVETKLVAQSINSITYDLKEVSKDELLATQAFLSDSHYLVNGTIATKTL